VQGAAAAEEVISSDCHGGAAVYAVCGRAVSFSFPAHARYQADRISAWSIGEDLGDGQLAIDSIGGKSDVCSGPDRIEHYRLPDAGIIGRTAKAQAVIRLMADRDRAGGEVDACDVAAERPIALGR